MPLETARQGTGADTSNGSPGFFGLLHVFSMTLPFSNSEQRPAGWDGIACALAQEDLRLSERAIGPPIALNSHWPE